LKINTYKLKDIRRVYAQMCDNAGKAGSKASAYTAIECMVQVQDQVDLPGPADAIKEATEDCTCSEPVVTAGLTEGQPALKAKSGIEMTGACGASMFAARWSGSFAFLKISLVRMENERLQMASHRSTRNRKHASLGVTVAACDYRDAPD